MNDNNNINWDWILKNMRSCNRCNVYKTLDQFNGTKERCHRCIIKRKVMTHEKPKPIRYQTDDVINQSINLKDLYATNGVKTIIKLHRKINL